MKKRVVTWLSAFLSVFVLASCACGPRRSSSSEPVSSEGSSESSESSSRGKESSRNLGPWQHDEETHWRVDLDNGGVFFEDEHDYEESYIENDEYGYIKLYTCKVCGYQYRESHDHIYDEEDWAFDSDVHFHESMCEHDLRLDEEEHLYDEGVVRATKDEIITTYTCEVCGYFYEEKEAMATHAHRSSGYYYDRQGHYQYCSACHAFYGAAAHNMVENDGVYTCSVCGFSYGDDSHAHTFSQTYSHNGEAHWRDATCQHHGLIDELGEHDFDDGKVIKQATSQSEGILAKTCKTCGYVIQEIIPVGKHIHTYETKWTVDDDTHYHAPTCEHTDLRGDEAPHDYKVGRVTAGTEDAAGGVDLICKVCGYINVKAIPLPRQIEGYVKQEDGTYLMGLYPQSEVTSEVVKGYLKDNYEPASEEAWTAWDEFALINADRGELGEEKTNLIRYKDVDIDEDGQADYRGIALLQCVDDGYFPTFTAYKAHWFAYEPIVWNEVIAEDDSVSLIAANVLDFQVYNTLYNVDSNRYIGNNYETANLKGWLEKDFAQTAFSATQTSLLMELGLPNRNTFGVGEVIPEPESSDYASLAGFANDEKQAYWTGDISYATGDEVYCRIHQEGRPLPTSSGPYESYHYETYHGIRPTITIAKEETQLIYVYDSNTDSYGVKGIKGEVPKVVAIPLTHLGKPVTKILAEAFREKSNIEHVILGDNIVKIEDEAFALCWRLMKVTWSKSLQSIGLTAFGATALFEVNFPESLKTIESFAFANCEHLKKIVLPKGLGTLGAKVFYQCDAVTEVTLPFIGANSLDKENVFGYLWGASSYRPTVFENNATMVPESLKKVTLLDSCWVIPAGAFSACPNIEEIVLPSTVTSIGKGAFYGLDELTTITLPFLGDGRDHPYIGYAFAYAEADIENNAAIVNSNYVGEKLTTVILNGACKDIAEVAFIACSNIVDVYLPISLTHIGEGAFANCSKLDDLHYEGTMDQWNEIRLDDRWYGSSGPDRVICSDGVLNV